MKVRSIVCIPVLALLVVGCSKDNPVDSKPEEPTELIVTQDVGTGGGTLSSDSVIVRIPSGALDSTYAVKLFQSSVVSPFDSLAVTDQYRLEGLPGDIAIPIDIYLKTRESVGDSTWVALGEPAVMVPGDTLGYSFGLYQVADSSGYLHLQFPPDADLAAPTLKPTGTDLKDLVFVLFGLYNVYEKSKTAHFEYVWHKEIYKDLSPLQDRMEAVYDSLVNRGIDFSPIKGLIKVGVYPGYMISSLPQTYYRDDKVIYQFSINYDVKYGIVDPEFLNEASGCLCQVAPVLYIKRDELGYYFWLRTALHYWGESEFGQLPDSCGRWYYTGELAPFNGMHTELYDGIIEQVFHGRGMVSFLKYLDDFYSPYVLANALEDMKVYNSHIFEALDKSTAVDLETWWPDYFKELIDGSLCPLEANTIVSSKSGTFTIDAADDTLETFSLLYHDLMAKVFYIGLNYTEFDDDDKLRLIASSDSIASDKLSVLLFTYKNSQLTFLAQGIDLTVAGIKAMHDNGQNLVAVVVNSHYNRTYFYPNVFNIDLKVQYLKNTGPTYEYCKIKCCVKPEWESYDGTIEWDSQNFSIQFAFEGYTTSGVFTGTPDPMWHGSEATGAMTVTFDLNTLEILTFAAETSTPIGATGRIDASIDGGGVPNTYTGTWLENEVVGSSACSYISSLGYFNLYNISEYHWETMRSFVCEDDTHYIMIELYDLE